MTKINVQTINSEPFHLEVRVSNTGVQTEQEHFAGVGTNLPT